MGVVKTGHSYQTCGDEFCDRYICRIYREGHMDGRETGYPEGWTDGYVSGYAAGFTDGNQK